MTWMSQYKRSLKHIITEEPVDLYFYRPIGFILAKLLQGLPVTPNHITMASMLCGISAGILYASGRAPTTLIAGFLFLIANILDCTDGQLARLKEISSNLGKIVDGLADYITGSAVVLGIAIGYSGVFCSVPIWWGLVVAAGASNIWQSILVDTHRKRFLILQTGRSQSVEEEYEEFAEKHRKCAHQPFDRFVIGMYLVYLSITMKISPGKPGQTEPVDREYLIRRNQPLVRAWTLIGSSARISIAVAASMINRPDLFLLAMVLPLNLFAMALFILQIRLDSREGI